MDISRSVNQYVKEWFGVNCKVGCNHAINSVANGFVINVLMKHKGIYSVIMSEDYDDGKKITDSETPMIMLSIEEIVPKKLFKDMYDYIFNTSVLKNEEYDKNILKGVDFMCNKSRGSVHKIDRIYITMCIEILLTHLLLLANQIRLDRELYKIALRHIYEAQLADEDEEINRMYYKIQFGDNPILGF
jgi:hypothetical protein